MTEQETIKDLSNAIHALRRKLIQKHNLQKKWRLQCEELLKVNTRLEKEIKKYKQEEANKLSGFLSIGAIHTPKIDRKYK
jgi:hypothetical protein